MIARGWQSVVLTKVVLGMTQGEVRQNFHISSHGQRIIIEHKYAITESRLLRRTRILFWLF